MLDAQLDKLDRIQERRARVIAALPRGLAGWARATGVRLPARPPTGPPTTTSSTSSSPEAARDRRLAALRAEGIMATFHYVPLHSSPLRARAARAPARFPVTDRVAAPPAAAAPAPAAGRRRRGARGRGRHAALAPERWPRRPYLSLVIACYNEEEHPGGRASREIREYPATTCGRPFEIVFVDDVSRDRTREILREIVAANPDVRPQRDPAREEQGPRRHRDRRLPRRARRDRGLPRRGPGGALPLHPLAGARHREGGRRGGGAPDLRLPAPLASTATS